ncbi:hypothetical protein [Algiphilus sp.]|uniref:hypothetical protein n=1 Tax=Algiphilus sp. TaxID=1872431 RepID=UPI003B520804
MEKEERDQKQGRPGQGEEFGSSVQQASRQALEASERVVTAMIDLGELTAQQILSIAAQQMKINDDFSEHCAAHFDTLCTHADSQELLDKQRALIHDLRQRVDGHAEVMYRIWSEGHRTLASIFERIDAIEEALGTSTDEANVENAAHRDH